MALALAPSPPKSIANSVQFSNVARFMGPSLRDQRHANFRAAGLKIPKLEKEKRRANRSVSSHQQSTPSSPSASEPAGASASFGSETFQTEASMQDDLRRDLALLEEEQRRELAKARVLETSIAETQRLERRAHRKAEQQRDVLQHHRRRHDSVGGQLSALRGQLEEQTQSAQRLYEARVAPGAGGSSGSHSCPQLPSARELPGLTVLRQPRARPLPPQSKSDDAALQRGASSAPQLTGSAEGSMTDTWSAGGDSCTLLDFFDQRDAEEKAEQKRKSKLDVRFISPASSFSGLRLRDVAAKKPESPEQGGSILDNHMKATWNTGCLDVLDEDPDSDMKRAAMRALMERHGGGRKPAFYRLDINQNGVVSYSEWENNFPVLLGITMPEERWAADRLKAKIKDVFRLFDHNGKGQLDLDKIFPGASNEDDVDFERMTTPEFWKHWGKGTQGVKSKGADRLSGWKPKDAYDELDIIMDNRAAQTDAVIRGKKLRQQWKRLKANGKSDGRVREIVALHLPRGTGAEDRDGVPMFGGADVQRVRSKYLEETNDKTRSIQKGLFDMREQRKTLMNARHQFAATLQPMMRKQAAANANKAEALKQFNAQMAAAEKIKADFAGALGGVRDKMKAETDPIAVVEDAGPSFKVLREKYGVDEDAQEDLYKVWMKFSDSADSLGRRQFIKFLTALCPTRHLVNCDVEAWWNQLVGIVTKGKPGFGTPPQSPKLGPPAEPKAEVVEFEDEGELTPTTAHARRTEAEAHRRREDAERRREKELRAVKCTFAHFVAWYHSCELRVKTQAELNAYA